MPRLACSVVFRRRRTAGRCVRFHASRTAFSPCALSGFGVSRSLVVVSEANQFGCDDVTLTVVPEPAARAMMIAGFGLVGMAAQRQGTPRA